MTDFGYAPVSPIGKEKVFGHRNTGESSPHIWGDFEVDVFPPSPKGKAMRTLRCSSGIGLRELSTATGLTATQLSNLERGRATCDWQRLFRVIESMAPESADAR